MTKKIFFFHIIVLFLKYIYCDYIILKKTLTTFLILSFSFLLIFNSYLFYKAGEEFSFTGFQPIEECESANEFNLYSKLKGIDSINLLNKFPYQEYLNNSNYCNLKSIIADFKIVDSMYKNRDELTIPLFYNLLTDSLINFKKNKTKKFNPDFLIKKINWAKKMKVASQLNQEYEIIFLIVYEGWLNHISNLLSSYFENDKNIKYNLKFKILKNECSLEKYTVPVGLRTHEKLIDYLIEGRYSYIWGRLYHGTSFWIKFAIIIFGLLTISSFFYSIKNILK